jgi:hypothetical protein
MTQTFVTGPMPTSTLFQSAYLESIKINLKNKEFP